MKDNVDKLDNYDDRTSKFVQVAIKVFFYNGFLRNALNGQTQGFYHEGQREVFKTTEIWLSTRHRYEQQ